MNESDNIFGCFVSGSALYHDSDQLAVDDAEEKGEIFRRFIWGANGLDERLKLLRHDSYGEDLLLVLFQFYLNPIPYELQHLKEIERFRKKEKSIGIPIIITDENFFDRTDSERQLHVKNALIKKMDLLADVIKRNKLDTNVISLKADLEKVLN